MSNALSPGQLVAGKYEVERIIGVGGMGTVVAAKHRTLGSRVAIKTISLGSKPSEEALARFEREARAAATLTSHHVCRVIDFGTGDDGAPFMVMEYLDGEDLAQRLRAKGLLSCVDAVRIIAEASDGIAEAHAMGIVHRDIKPSNIFLVKKPQGGDLVKVLDFGIAKTQEQSADAHALTGTAALLGSPQYMSPEQVRGAKGIDSRTDVWSLGATLYEAITGQPPFSGEQMFDVLMAIVNTPPASLVALRPDAPPALELLVMRCLAKNPADRFANAAELAEALERMRDELRGGLGTTVSGSSTPLGTGAAVRTVPDVTVQGAPPPAAPSAPSNPSVTTGSGRKSPVFAGTLMGQAPVAPASSADASGAHAPAAAPSAPSVEPSAKVDTVGPLATSGIDRGSFEDLPPLAPKKRSSFGLVAAAVVLAAAGGVLALKGSSGDPSPSAASGPAAATDAPAATQGGPSAPAVEPSPPPAITAPSNAAPPARPGASPSPSPVPAPAVAAARAATGPGLAPPPAPPAPLRAPPVAPVAAPVAAPVGAPIAAPVAPPPAPEPPPAPKKKQAHDDVEGAFSNMRAE
jgi:serine/threonine protein kinase